MDDVGKAMAAGSRGREEMRSLVGWFDGLADEAGALWDEVVDATRGLGGADLAKREAYTRYKEDLMAFMGVCSQNLVIGVPARDDARGPADRLAVDYENLMLNMGGASSALAESAAAAGRMAAGDVEGLAALQAARAQGMAEEASARIAAEKARTGR